MNRLVDAERNGDCGMIGQAAFSRPMQVLAPLDGAVQSRANMDVVVEVAQASATYPAVRVSASWSQLVRGTQADLLEFIVQAIFPWEEAPQRRHVIPRHSVVVASEDEPFELRSWHVAQAFEHRGDECLLAYDLAVAPVARRDVHANEGYSPRSRVECHCRSAARKRDRHVLGKVAHNSDSARQEDAAFVGIARMMHAEPTCAQTLGQQVSAGAASLGQHDHIVSTRP